MPLARCINISFSGAEPVAIQLRWDRRHRDGTLQPVTGLVHLDAAAREALSAALNTGVLRDAELRFATGEITDYALFEADPSILTVDPRIELAVELGADLRVAQVILSKWSDVALDPTEHAPYGSFEPPSAPHKPADRVAFNWSQRIAIDHAL